MREDTLKIMFLVLSDCVNFPLMRADMSTLSGSGMRCLGINSDTGHAVSKPFPISHGKLWFSDFFYVRN